MILNECSICKVSGRKQRLFEAISLKEKNIITVCKSCSEKEGLPIVKRPTTSQLKEAENPSRIYPKYSQRNYPSYPPKDFQSEFQRPVRRSLDKDKENITLREIVDKNYVNSISKEKKPRPHLIDNFHWNIMRARRFKKITQEQLAKEISESLSAIKMAEKGILPDDDTKIIKKLESFLGIQLTKKDPKDTEFHYELSIEKPQEPPARILKFDPEVTKNLTLSDLQKMKEESEKAEKEFNSI